MIKANVIYFIHLNLQLGSTVAHGFALEQESPGFESTSWGLAYLCGI